MTPINLKKGQLALVIGFFIGLLILVVQHDQLMNQQKQNSLASADLRVKYRDNPDSINNEIFINGGLYHKIPGNLPRPNGIYQKQQKLRGMIFSGESKMGDQSGEIVGDITLSVVKSISPPVIEHVKEIFNDEHGENIYFATIPAMIKLDDRIKIVQRIWLGQFEKMKTLYRSKGLDLGEMFNEWQNSWQENHFYEMDVDENYNMLAPGQIMGIPTTTNIKFTYKSDGPMDPRLASIGEEYYLFFHSWLVDKNSGDIGGRIHTYDMKRHIKKKMWPHITLQRTEINWIPIDVKGQLYYTYSIDPLRVMRCDPKTGDCGFIYEQDGTSEHPFKYSNDHLRGGTPWVVYKYPYYLSLAHNVVVTYTPYEDFAIYNVNLVVISVDPWRVVYVSRDIQANSKWLESEPVIRNHTIVSPFWYPTGIILWDEDTFDISCHLNDASGHILRLKGLKSIMDQVLAEDARNIEKKGPVVRVPQQYVLESSKDIYRGQWTFQGDIIEHTVEGVDIYPDPPKTT